MNRRQFFGVVIAASAFVAACSSGLSRRDRLGPIAALVGDGDGIDAIGRHAVDIAAVGRDAAALETALRLSPTERPEDARRRIEAAVTDDFVAGRVVDVAAWQLSLTEARIAALVHLRR